MPTASTAKKVTTPRKRRTRKTTTTAVKSATLNNPVVKKTVTKEEPVKSIRPAKPNLTWEDYRADAIVTAIDDNIRYHEACMRASKRLLLLVKRTNRRQTDNESNVIALKSNNNS